MSFGLLQTRNVISQVPSKGFQITALPTKKVRHSRLFFFLVGSKFWRTHLKILEDSFFFLGGGVN